MSLGAVLLAVWLILMGLGQLGIYATSNTLLGLLALIAGIIWLVEAVHPFKVFERRAA